jgi:hypothetical protein
MFDCRDSTVLGTAVQYLAQNSICPMLIVKDTSAQRKNRPDGHYRFGVCTDGSIKSLDTIAFLGRIMRPGDHLVVIAVGDEIVHTDKVQVSVENAVSHIGYVSLF